MLSATQLTTDQRLVVQRRRLGETQDEAAARWGVSPWAYRCWERGGNGAPTGIRLGRLADHESCFLMRRHWGMSRKECAAAMGISQGWLTQMERGQVCAEKLAEFWSSRWA